VTASRLAAPTTAGGIVMLDPVTSQVQRVYTFVYYPDTVSRTVTPQPAGAETGDRLDALRLKAPAIETIRVDLEIDATDWLDKPNDNAASQLAAQYGLLPHLAVLESVLSPTYEQIRQAQQDVASGILEVSPAEAPLTIFVWNPRRSVAVRITELTATEESFDTSLNPIRVRVSLAMRVLTTNDLPSSHPGANVYVQHLQQQEALQRRVPRGALTDVGLTSLPGTRR
jgi:hypothetical protein